MNNSSHETLRRLTQNYPLLTGLTLVDDKPTRRVNFIQKTVMIILHSEQLLQIILIWTDWQLY